MRARYELSLVPSRAMTPPALKRPTGWPSKTHICWPSTSSTRGTRSLNCAGARLVKRSGGLAPVRVGVDDEHILQH